MNTTLTTPFTSNMGTSSSRMKHLPAPQFPLVPPQYNLMNSDGLPNVPHTLKVMDHMYNGQFRKWVCDDSNLQSAGPIIARIANEGHDIPRIANAIKWMTLQWPLASTASLLKMIMASWALTSPESCHCSLHTQPLSANACGEKSSTFNNSHTLSSHSDHTSISELADKSCACCSCSNKLSEEHASYRRQLNRAGRLCALLTVSWEPHLIAQLTNAILEKWVCQYQRESFVMTLTQKWDFSRLSYFLISLGDRPRLSHQTKVSLLRAAATGTTSKSFAQSTHTSNDARESQSNKCAKRSPNSSPGSSTTMLMEPPELYHRSTSSSSICVSPTSLDSPISMRQHDVAPTSSTSLTNPPRRTITSTYIARYDSGHARRIYTQSYHQHHSSTLRHRGTSLIQDDSSTAPVMSSSSSSSPTITSSTISCSSSEVDMSSPSLSNAMMMMDVDSPAPLSRSMPRALPLPQPPQLSSLSSSVETNASSLGNVNSPVCSLRSRPSQESLTANPIESSLPSGEAKDMRDVVVPNATSNWSTFMNSSAPSTTTTSINNHPTSNDLSMDQM